MTNAQEFTPATFKDGLKGHTSFDGGDLDCGNGLLLLIRKHLDPLDPGKFLEIASVDSTVEVDLPSWCSMTGNDLVDT
ncbi:MAG: 5-methyltetrahydropteroyltriglutamate--homocysteine methyltransferase, partial [Dermabacter sp.]|nr:5-methyltetrahydropteroyltriglutamate--homocysteine methyltransferase [Dermabacter sp.]